MENVHIINILKVNVLGKLFYLFVYCVLSFCYEDVHASCRKGFLHQNISPTGKSYDITILFCIFLRLKLGMRQVKDFITDRVKKALTMS